MTDRTPLFVAKDGLSGITTREDWVLCSLLTKTLRTEADLTSVSGSLSSNVCIMSVNQDQLLVVNQDLQCSMQVAVPKSVSC